jgi:hypothetical protein
MKIFKSEYFNNPDKIIPYIGLSSRLDEPSRDVEVHDYKKYIRNGGSEVNPVRKNLLPLLEESKSLKPKSSGNQLKTQLKLNFNACGNSSFESFREYSMLSKFKVDKENFIKLLTINKDLLEFWQKLCWDRLFQDQRMDILNDAQLKSIQKCELIIYYRDNDKGRNFLTPFYHLIISC